MGTETATRTPSPPQGLLQAVGPDRNSASLETPPRGLSGELRPGLHHKDTREPWRDPNSTGLPCTCPQHPSRDLGPTVCPLEMKPVCPHMPTESPPQVTARRRGERGLGAGQDPLACAGASSEAQRTVGTHRPKLPVTGKEDKKEPRTLVRPGNKMGKCSGGKTDRWEVEDKTRGKQETEGEEPRETSHS